MSALNSGVTSTNWAALDSPAFINTPIAPTAAAGTNNTQIATTAFVASAVSTVTSSIPTNTSDLNNNSGFITLTDTDGRYWPFTRLSSQAATRYLGTNDWNISIKDTGVLASDRISITMPGAAGHGVNLFIDSGDDTTELFADKIVLNSGAGTATSGIMFTHNPYVLSPESTPLANHLITKG